MLLTAFCLASCQRDPVQTAAYYPVDSLISAQVIYLTSVKATLIKQASIGLKSDTSSYVPADSIAWSNELGILAQLGLINKPIYRGLYSVRDGLADPRSNLKVRFYEGEAGKDLPVPFLKIYYQDSPARIRRIEGVCNDVNSLYASSRNLSIELQEINNKTVLTSYTVDGGQKMTLADSTRYHIDARISIR